MTAARLPPILDGFTYLSSLGGGGFSDVFLYRQHLPDRQVAIKVLHETATDDESRRLFGAEANLMARVSSHPNIVTIHGAGVSADGRPYLTMEFYPLAHFGDRIKEGPLAVHTVLEVGIKIASAVETAHRAQIIHRDIKPANILTSDFGEPGLTDFGISATQTDQSIGESLGFSPPYAPPEILADEHPGDQRSDVYSLAATLWAMLAGHSPFEIPGERNSRADIIRRGLNEPVRPLPRADVPRRLELVLQQALAKDPAQRPASTLSFAMALQNVEQELGYRPTALNLLQNRSKPQAGTTVGQDELPGVKTKVGKGKVVNPDGEGLPIRTDPGGAPLISQVPEISTGTVLRGQAAKIESLTVPAAPEEPGTIRVTRLAPQSPPPEPEPERSMPRWAWAAMGIGLAGVLAVIAFVAFGGQGDSSRPSEISTANQVDANPLPGGGGASQLDPVTDVQGTRSGTTVTFTWTHAARQDLQYVVTRADSGADPRPSVVADTQFVLTDVAATDTPCITVTARVEGVVESAISAPACAK